MPGNHDFKTEEKNVLQKVLMSKKKVASTEIRTSYLTPDLLLGSQLHYQLGQMCSVVCNGMLLSVFFNPLKSDN